MRADRLVAALLLLQSRGQVTAAELAAELEVSVATARRDLEALSSSGIPVYSQAGRGGGWSLVGGARTDLSGLTAAEAQALFLLIGPSASLDADVRSALRKLVRALPDTFRADALAAAEAVVVDSAAWGERDRERRPELVETLQNAVVRKRKVRLDYENHAGTRTKRVVDPWGLVDKGEVWYFLAGTEDGQRTFRVDRIVAAAVTDEPARRPPDLQLDEEWRRVVDRVERRRSLLSATVRIDERLVPILRSQFGRHVTVESVTEGRATVRVAADTARSIAQVIAGWGATVEVVEPEPVRAELARLGAELVARYGASGPAPAPPTRSAPGGRDR